MKRFLTAGLASLLALTMATGCTSAAGLLDEVHEQGAAVGVPQPHRDGGPLQLMPVGSAAVHPLGAELRRRQGGGESLRLPPVVKAQGIGGGAPYSSVR